MQQITARLLQAPVTLPQTLPVPHLAQTSPGPPVEDLSGPGISSLFSQLRAGVMSGLWCRLVALTSTRPRLGVLKCEVRWHMEHWGCKDSSEGLQGGGSWIPPGSWNPQGVSEANFVFNYSWWHFEFVLKATSEPPLLSQLLCSSVKNLDSRAWGQDKDYATLQQGWTTTARDMRNIPIQTFSKQGRTHTKTPFLIKVPPIMTFLWYCVQNPPLERDYMQSMLPQTPLKC